MNTANVIDLLKEAALISEADAEEVTRECSATGKSV